MKTIQFHLLKTLAVVLPVAFSAVSCGDDDDDYSRAPEPSVSDCGVYFPSSNESEYIKTEEDKKSISVTIARDNTAGELTVPIVVESKTDNIADITESVTFADGADRAQIVVTYTNLDKAPACRLSIPEAFTNPYKVKDGSVRFSFSIYKLKMLCSTVKYATDGSGTAYFDKVTTSQLLQYEGENKFIWRDFLGSGIDLKFKINGTFDEQDVTNSYGEVVPLDHCAKDEEGWYLTVDKNGDESLGYAIWELPEGNAVNSYFYSWFQYEDYTYFTIDLRPNESSKGTYGYAYNYSSVVDDDSNYHSFYVYLYY